MIKEHVFPLALKLIKDRKKDDDVHDSWGGVAVEILTSLPYEQLKYDLDPFLLSSCMQECMLFPSRA